MACPDPTPQAPQQDRDHPADLHLQDTHPLPDPPDPQASRAEAAALPTPPINLVGTELTALEIKILDHHLGKEEARAGREGDLLEWMKGEVEEILEAEEEGGLRPAGKEI